jgi:hypothetical protein
MSTDIRVTEALARANASEPLIAEWLQNRLEQHQKATMTLTDEVAVRWAQGRAQELAALLKELGSAAETLRKVDSKASK